MLRLLKMLRLPFISSLFALNKNNFKPMTHHGLGIGKTRATAISDDAAVVKTISAKIRTCTNEVAKEEVVKPSNAWSCSAKVLASEETCAPFTTIDPYNVKINYISGYGSEDDNPFQTVSGTTFDTSMNADWMEYIENLENRVNDEGGAGAYDVFRCDLISAKELTANGDEEWRVWGEDHHLERLQRSYCTLMNEMRNTTRSITESTLNEALEESKSIVKALRKEASTKLMTKFPETRTKDDTLIQLVKVSLLWSPQQHPSISSNSTSMKSNKIVVRGHACSNARPFLLHKQPEPIMATVALSLQAHEDCEEEEENLCDAEGAPLPSRARCPQAKIASWGRLRKPLEDPDTYKPPGVGEVLMLRPKKKVSEGLLIASDELPDMEILEGLTSNFFVIYKDGTLRTAEEGVLHGYVRHLILECAEKCGLTLDLRPVSLNEAGKGIWKEAFITSSSRLIYPISRILVPHEEIFQQSITKMPHISHGNVHFAEFWRDPYLLGEEVRDQEAQWQNLLNEMLRYIYSGEGK